MLSTLLVAAMTVGVAQDVDTVLAADGVRRLVVEQHKGSVVVRAWNRDQIRVEADLPRRSELDVRRRGGTVFVELDRPRPSIEVDYVINVPEDMDLNIEGLKLDIEVEGVDGRIILESLQGGITVRNSRGRLDAETLSGGITVDGFDGDVMASSTSHSVTLSGVRGAIEVEAVSGTVDLYDITASALSVESVSGGIEFSGSLGAAGHHHLTSHSGQVLLDLDPDMRLTLEVSHHSGSVDMDYPDATLVETHHGTSIFELNGGGADVEVETFSGRVTVRQRRR